MAEGSISTSDLSSYVLGGLFDNDYARNYYDVGELSNKTLLTGYCTFHKYITSLYTFGPQILT